MHAQAKHGGTSACWGPGIRNRRSALLILLVRKRKKKGRVKSRAVAFVLSRNSSGKLATGERQLQAASASQPPVPALSLASDFSGPFFIAPPALHRAVTYDGPFCASPALHPSRPDRAAIRALLEWLDTSLIAGLFFYSLPPIRGGLRVRVSCDTDAAGERLILA